MFNPENPPEITAARWFNSADSTSLRDYKGQVVVVAIFQILCPGSIKHGLPQALRLRRAFQRDQLAVIGLHMAFERPDEQSPEKVAEFLEVNEIGIPVAYDKLDRENLPLTMQAYELQGTPALLIFDRQGRVRRHYLGAVDDVRIGAEIMALLMEDKEASREFSIALENKLAATLTDPEEDHPHHHHDGSCCGHDHGHDAHDHAHDHHHHDGGSPVSHHHGHETPANHDKSR